MYRQISLQCNCPTPQKQTSLLPSPVFKFATHRYITQGTSGGEETIKPQFQDWSLVSACASAAWRTLRPVQGDDLENFLFAKIISSSPSINAIHLTFIHLHQKDIHHSLIWSQRHHIVRRAALRAASSSPSVAFVSTPRSITTASPFLRSRLQATGVSSSVFRRFASDDAASLNSADGEKSTVSSAIGSAAESASTYSGEAAESLGNSAEQTGGSYGNVVRDTAAGAAAGRAFQPRGDRGDRRPSRPAYDNRSSGYSDRAPSGYGSDRLSDRRRPYPPPEFKPNPSLYVGNLLFDITASDLEEEFSQFGTVKSTAVATDARGLSKGFAYVTFESTEQATAAIEAKHETIYEGRRLVVNFANNLRQDRVQNQASKTLFIGNLAFEMSDADINNLFRDVKNVIDVRVAIDRRTGQPRGFAHAEFVDVESATKAIEVLKDEEVYGRKLRLDYSSGKTARDGPSRD
ncbi:uncharacterized protein BP5553_02917 [Venustampulla echinocandica]|uniref:RRM domain-containing protein n=1 Tax=Venustampulla echinocandica TaxID=2656787 RepID=A0A370TSS1_9HELO|nr:uncharacterized protein BP5553_02917 [Venustampulla echinocandica]RDL38577.1 hypothetical protein BP5553_02917 [Venustampulla echinocandica]